MLSRVQAEDTKRKLDQWAEVVTEECRKQEVGAAQGEAPAPRKALVWRDIRDSGQRTHGRVQITGKQSSMTGTKDQVSEQRQSKLNLFHG